MFSKTKKVDRSRLKPAPKKVPQKPIETNIYLVQYPSGTTNYRVVVSKYGMRFDHIYKTLSEAKKQKAVALKSIEKYKSNVRKVKKFVTDKTATTEYKHIKNEKAKATMSKTQKIKMEPNIIQYKYETGTISYRAHCYLLGNMEVGTFDTLKEAQQFKAAMEKKKELMSTFGKTTVEKSEYSPKDIVEEPKVIEAPKVHHISYEKIEPNIRTSTSTAGRTSYLVRVGDQNKTFSNLEDARDFKKKHLKSRTPHAVENCIYLYHTRKLEERYNVMVRVDSEVKQKTFHTLQEAREFRGEMLNLKDIIKQQQSTDEPKIIMPMMTSFGFNMNQGIQC